ncbi:Hsp20/alpha crystallin family protein [Nocardia higoensis]|nr:Hsp20/alpha crystallin family protein [Nocardia higoensis]
MNARTPQLHSRSPFPALTSWFAGLPAVDAMRPFFEGHPIRMEVDEKDDQVVVRAEMPGVDPDEDVSVTVREGLLTIRAERTEKREANGRSEFEYGSFSRTIALPAGAREDDITAGYDKGILTITVPVAESDQPAGKKIPISSGG